MRLKHLASVLAAGLVFALPGYAGSATAAAPADPAVAKARAALAKVDQAFAKKASAKGVKRGAAPLQRVDATMALRDLMLAKHSLTGAERKRAESYFARPTNADPNNPSPPYTVEESKPECGPNVCVHYVSSTDDAPPDGQVTKSLSIAEEVWTQEVSLGGFTPPRPDLGLPNQGPDQKLDIYLANLTDNGLYGYCTSDDPYQGPPYRVSAYCVIDDDFVGYGTVTTPDDNLRVTVAHEFFHAVQFAYEYDEDLWFMEGTAAWIEDEVYDSINDNMFYLNPQQWRANPILRPDIPLDRFDNQWPDYGAWTFWKYLGERYPAKTGNITSIIREVWEVAADPNIYSTRALEIVLRRHGTNFDKFFTKWSVGNRFPKRSYSEAAANGYPKAPLSGRFSLSPRKRSTGWRHNKRPLDHMASLHARFKPRGLKGKKWRLLVTVDAGKKAASKCNGCRATLIVYKKNGKIAQVKVPLNRRGNGTKRVPFGKASVKHVEITLTNAGHRFTKCWQQQTPFSCSGVSKDDNQRYRFNARVLGR